MNKVRCFFIVLALSLALLVPGPASATRLSISLIPSGGGSLEGAWVTLLAYRGVKTQIADHYNSANFSVRGACCDLKYPLTIQVHKPGFKVTTKIIRWQSRDYLSSGICYSRSGSSDLISINVEQEQTPQPDPSNPPGFVKVYLERQGQPTGGVLVRLFNAHHSRLLISNAQGYAEFSGVPPAGDYTVTLNPQDSQPATWSNVRVQSDQTTTLQADL